MDYTAKLTQAQSLDAQIKELAKQIDIVEKVITTALEASGEYPKMAMHLQPKSSNTMPLTSAYIPVDPKSFYDSYVKNMVDNKKGLETQLDNIFK